MCEEPDRDQGVRRDDVADLEAHIQELEHRLEELEQIIEWAITSPPTLADW